MFSRYGITENESNSFMDCLTDLVVKIRQPKWSEWTCLFYSFIILEQQP